MIELSKIRIDGGTQPRAELHQETVAEYAEAYKSGTDLPPVMLFYDGSEFWLADGFHRFFGAKAAGITAIAENITPGTLRDAILYSLSANSKHGLKRSNADKRKAVQTMLDDAEWSQWSSREIAKHCSVGHPLVEEMRKLSLEDLPVSDQKKRSYTTKHGTTTTMNTANIGKKKGAENPKPEHQEAEAPDEPAEEAQQTKNPKQKPVIVSEDRAAEITAENAELRERIAEIARDAQEAIEDNSQMAAIFEADDRLAAAMAEIKRLKAEVASLKEQLAGAIGTRNEAIRSAKYYKSKCEKVAA